MLEKRPSNKVLLFDLRKRLLGRIGMDDIHGITCLIQNNDEDKQNLYDLAFDEEDTVAINTLWIMTHFSLYENEWLYQKQDEIIDRLMLVTNSSQRRFCFIYFIGNH